MGRMPNQPSGLWAYTACTGAEKTGRSQEMMRSSTAPNIAIGPLAGELNLTEGQGEPLDLRKIRRSQAQAQKRRQGKTQKPIHGLLEARGNRQALAPAGSAQEPTPLRDPKKFLLLPAGHATLKGGSVPQEGKEAQPIGRKQGLRGGAFPKRKEEALGEAEGPRIRDLPGHELPGPAQKKERRLQPGEILADFGEILKEGGLPQKVEAGAPPIVDDLREVQDVQDRAERALQAPRALHQKLQPSPALRKGGDDAIGFRVVLGAQNESFVPNELGQGQSGAPARMSREREAPMRLAPACTILRADA